MVIASVFHLLIQVPSFIAHKFEWKMLINIKDRDVTQSFKLSLSSFMATVVSQLILLVENSLSLLISSASVIYFKFSDQLRYFPVHLFGASIAAAALPILATESEDDIEVFVKTVKTSLLQIIYLSLPVSVLLIVLKIPLVRIVYGADKFTWEDTVTTAFCLGIFSLSIFSQSCNIFLSKCFYALKNTTIPLVGSLITLLVTASFPIYFIYSGYEVWIVVLGFVIGTYVNLAYFLLKLTRKVRTFSLRELFLPIGKILFSGLIPCLVREEPKIIVIGFILIISTVLNNRSLSSFFTLTSFNFDKLGLLNIS
jgi:putative peptidoglycan lipid II flippase